MGIGKGIWVWMGVGTGIWIGKIGATHRHQAVRYILGGLEPHPPCVPVPDATHLPRRQVSKYCFFVGAAPGQSYVSVSVVQSNLHECLYVYLYLYTQLYVYLSLYLHHYQHLYLYLFPYLYLFVGREGRVGRVGLKTPEDITDRLMAMRCSNFPNPDPRPHPHPNPNPLANPHLIPVLILARNHETKKTTSHHIAS
jgi:hypothetical protein